MHRGSTGDASKERRQLADLPLHVSRLDLNNKAERDDRVAYADGTKQF